MDIKGTILIVDDSPVVLSMLAEVLTASGFTVNRADSGEQALASISATLPDLVLLDILMPGMDGFEVCRRLKEHEESCGIPVILLTTLDNLDDKLKGLRLGAVDYVIKPFQSEELLARVNTHLEISRMNEELRRKSIALNKSQHLLAETERIGKVGGWEFNILTGKQLWTEGVYTIHEVDRAFTPTVENGINFYTQDSRQVIERAVQRAIEFGEPFDLELEIITAKGNLRSVNTIGKADLEHSRIYGFLQDITDRKLFLEMLQKSRLLLNETGRIARVGGWEFDAETLDLMWTDEVYRIHEVDMTFHTTVSEAINFYAPASRPLIERAVQRAIEHGEPFDAEMEIITAKGNHKWVHAIGNVQKEHGKSRKVFGVFQDITQRRQVELNLQLANDRLRSFIDANIVGVIVANPLGKFIEANDYYLRMIGYSREEFAAGLVDWRAITPPEWLQADEEAISELREHGTCKPYEKEYLRRDGTRVTVLLTDAMLPGPEEQIIAFALDVTERSQMVKLQHFLARTTIGRKGASFFEELALYLAKSLEMEFICIDRLEGDGLNATTLAMWYDGKFEGNVTYALKDTPCGDVVGKEVCCFPEQVCRLFPNDQVLRDLRAESYIGVTLWSHDGKPIGLIAVIGHKPLRNRLLAEAMLKLVAVRAAGELERLDSEEKLSRSEAEFRRLSLEFHGLLDAIPDSLMLLDRDLKIIWVNRSAFETIGLTSETVGGKYCYSLLYERTSPCESCPAMESFSTGKPCSETVTRPDGRIWDVRTVPLVDGKGKIINVIALNRDITEHRKLEAQLRQSQKMESIGTMAGGIAHDFNNILTAIIGYGQIALMNMTEDNTQRQNIQHMLDASDRAAHLTRELLLFSRKQDADKKTADLNEIIIKVEKFLKKVIGEDIEFRTVLHESPLLVLADNHQLEQVLMNLATNARDSMPKGGRLSLTTATFTLDEKFVSAQGYGKPGLYALLAVADNGLGMDQETQERIFEPFFTTKEVGKGTGLGLAVVYGIIKQHDGYINVYSEPGTGSTFRIFLPIIDAGKVEESRAEQGETVSGGTETILLAEDDEMVRHLTKSLLTEFGYTVIEAVDGADAVSKFAENSDAIDLLLFDIVMPNLNGKDAFDEIRKVRSEIKIIFSSGYATETIRQKVSLGDGVQLIAKPLSPMELLRKVRKVLDGGG